jgi:hypothetical protein
MICPNERDKCNKIMVKKDEGAKWIEWVCTDVKCRSLKTVMKTDPNATGPFTEDQEYWDWRSQQRY